MTNDVDGLVVDSALGIVTPLFSGGFYLVQFAARKSILSEAEQKYNLVNPVTIILPAMFTRTC